MTGDSHKLTLTLCLLTWNEVNGCKKDVPRLPLHEFEQVYAVDGGSSDGTVEYLASVGITVIPQSKRGYNQAYLTAFENCKTDALVLFHPKGSVDPSSVLKFRPLFKAGNDLVIASRMIKGARNEEDANILKPRKWFVLTLAAASAMLWWRSGPLILDMLHGFRGMRRDRFFAIEPLEEGLSIDLEMVVRSYRKGYRIVEFPIIESARPFGDTHFKALPAGKRLLAYLWKELWRRA